MPIKIRINAVYIFYFAYLMNIVGCKSQTSNFTLSPNITKYTSQSLDLPSIVGNEYKIISSAVKRGVLLAKATKADTSFFIGVDLLKGRVFFIIPDPSNNYVSSTFDLNNDKVFSLSSLTPSEIFIGNIETGNIQRKLVDFEKTTRPGQIFLNQNQIFLINDVYGVGVINQTDYSKVIFHNEGITGLVNPQSSTLSFPIDNSLNLLSGHVIANNTIQLYAIDSRDSVKWTYTVKQNAKREEVSILNVSNTFVVKFDSILISLNKENGKEIWRNTLNSSIKGIFKWENKILVYCLVNPKGIYSDNDDFEYQIELSLFEYTTGKELWKIRTNSINVPHLGICSNLLLLSDNKFLRVFSLGDGRLIEKEIFSKRDKGDYAFEMLFDIVTGSYYLKSYNGKVYW